MKVTSQLRSAPRLLQSKRLLAMCGLLAAACLPVAAQTQAAGAGAASNAAPNTAPNAAPNAAPITAASLAADERIVLNGRLDHPAWQRANPHTAFVEKAPNTGAQPRHATEVRLLFDHQALYVGVRSWDAQPAQIRAPLVRHDGVNRTQDFVVAYIDAIGQRQSAQFFRINAAGAMADGLHTAADDSEDFAPDFDWDGAAQQDEHGWTAVLRIPFASLRYTGQQGLPWRFMLARRVPREQFYLHSSVLIARDAPSFIHNLQPLVGLQLPGVDQFLTLRPSLTWRRSVHQPGDGSRQQQTGLEAALDVKWRPMPELVLDATLNPDFSQVALDVPQLQGNRRFALQFDEKRPFFFEATDLLRSPTDALYSRSITDPRWGLRGTWRGTSLAGTAYAMHDRGGAVVLLPGAYGTDYAEQPGAQVQVARARVDAGALQWGALASQRRYDHGLGHNQVLGPDLGWQLSEAWRLRAQWLASHTTALAQADGNLAAGPAQTGHKAYAKLWYQTPRLEADLWVDDVSRHFRNDQGFVYQNGVRSLGGRLGRGWQGLGPFNEFWLNLEGSTTRDRRLGQQVSTEWHPHVWLTGAHNLEAWLHWYPRAAQRIGPDQPLLRERYWRGGLVFTPAPWVGLFNVEVRAGRLVDVAARALRPGGEASLSFTARPWPAVELAPSLSVQWLRHQGQQVYRETGHQLIGRWFIDARHSLRAIVQRSSHQRLAEAAHGLHPGIAAAHDTSTVGSLTWSWRQSSGTELHLGASRLQARPGMLPGSSARANEVFAKLQVDMDELRQRWPR